MASRNRRTIGAQEITEHRQRGSKGSGLAIYTDARQEANRLAIEINMMLKTNPELADMEYNELPAAFRDKFEKHSNLTFNIMRPPCMTENDLNEMVADITNGEPYDLAFDAECGVRLKKGNVSFYRSVLNGKKKPFEALQILEPFEARELATALIVWANAEEARKKETAKEMLNKIKEAHQSEK